MSLPQKTSREVYGAKRPGGAGVGIGLLVAGLTLTGAACNQPMPSEQNALAAQTSTSRASARGEQRFTKDFRLEECTFASSGHTPYFPLVPGHVSVFKGEEGGAVTVNRITTLHETLNISGIETRVVEEHQTDNGELVEISRNYFAVCTQNNSVFYFGEDVDIYEHGKIVNHAGSWRHGVNGARAGLVMPGLPLLGSRFFQEIAPEVALDRAEIIRLDAVVETPFGPFRKVLVTDETTPLEPGAVESKSYAPDLGLVVDGGLKLVSVSNE